MGDFHDNPRIYRHCFAIVLVEGIGAMSEFNWRSPQSYQRAIESGEMADFAWESLRRSPNYRADYQHAFSIAGQVDPEFRRRWGICFRS